jgi:hypothetical protein
MFCEKGGHKKLKYIPGPAGTFAAVQTAEKATMQTKNEYIISVSPFLSTLFRTTMLCALNLSFALPVRTRRTLINEKGVGGHAVDAWRLAAAGGRCHPACHGQV